MRRILFLLTCVCMAAIAAEATAQQCCKRRPILRRACCNQVAITTQTVSTGYNTAAIAGSTCCTPAHCMQTPQVSYSMVLPSTPAPVASTIQNSFPLNTIGNAATAPATMAQPSGTVTTASQPLFTPTYTQTSLQVSQGYASGGLAQRKAQRAAQMRLRGHLGGSLGSANYEGVGWSTVSAQHAISNCCYWGQRPVAEIGVARGADGFWYACVLYR